MLPGIHSRPQELPESIYNFDAKAVEKESILQRMENVKRINSTSLVLRIPPARI